MIPNRQLCSVALAALSFSACALPPVARADLLIDHIGIASDTTDTPGFESSSSAAASSYSTAAARFTPDLTGDLTVVSAVIWGPANWTGYGFAVDVWDSNPGLAGAAGAQLGNVRHTEFAAPSGGSLTTPWSTFFAASNYKVSFNISSTRVQEGVEYWVAVRITVPTGGQAAGVAVSRSQGDGASDVWTSNNVNLACQPSGSIPPWGFLPQFVVGSEKKFAYQVDFVPCRPSIITQPQSVSASSGQNAIFSVGVVATEQPVQYQWRRNLQPLADGPRVTGVNTANLAISGAQTSDNGTYDVLVSNACGFVTSNGALLTITPAACVGDLNGDHLVNLTDLSILLANFGVPTGATLSQGDLSGDGAVNLTDLSILLSNFGASCP